MSSPKAKKTKPAKKPGKAAAAKPAAAASTGTEPTRDEKAAFVKAMLHGIQPGTKAAEVMAEKKAGGKKAAAAGKTRTTKAEKPAAKSAKTSKISKTAGKSAKKAVSKPDASASAPAAMALPDDEPRVEILRKISAPEPVVSTPKSEELLKLAKEIETALENGDLEFLQPHALQTLMMALCKYYAASDENDIVYPILPGRLAISGTDAMVVCGALLRAVDLQVFELGMFQSWSGR